MGNMGLLGLIVYLGLGGCMTGLPLPTSAVVVDGEELSPRTAGYSLLYEVARKEAMLPALFILRSPSTATRKLTEEIAEQARQAARQLETFAQDSTDLRLDVTFLPVDEAYTHYFIEEEMRNELLFGRHFERSLLLSQINATRYMSVMARHLSKAETDPDRKRYFKQLADRMKKFRERATGRLSVVEE